MKNQMKRTWMTLALSGLLAGSAGAAVTLTESTIPITGTSTCAGTPTDWAFDVPVAVLENDLLQVVIYTAPRGTPTDCGYSDVTSRVAALKKKTGEGTGLNQLNRPVDFPAYLDRVNAKSGGGYTVTLHYDNTDADPANDDSEAKQSIAFEGVVNAGTADAPLNFPVRKVYRLRDGSKVLETEMQFRNESGAMFNASNPQNGLQTLIYATPGGASPAGADEVQVKTVSGLDTLTTGTAWWGVINTGTPKPELAEGWMAAVDTETTVSNILTWDLDKQKVFSKDGAGVSSNKAFFGSNRIQMEVLFNNLDAGQTLNYNEYLIVDEGVPVVSYASHDSVIAGVSLPLAAYNQGAAVRPTFALSSTKAAGTPDAAYDIKNIRVVKAGDETAVVTLPDSLNVILAGSARTTFTKQFTLNSSVFEPGNYLVMADLYPKDGATKISTLISRSFLVNSADVKVVLYEDLTNNTWVLENELYRIVLTDKGEINQFIMKEADNRNQVNGSYNLFRDYVRTTGNLTGFTGYTAMADPFGTDSPTRKSIQFGPAYNIYADLTKVFTLESNARSLKVDFTAINFDPEPLGAQGFFSHLAMAPGGSGNAADQFTARTISGMATPHTASQRLWFGAEGTTGATATVKLAAQPEIAEPWMAVTDRVVGDAMALTWDMATQKQYSAIPEGATEKVTQTSLFQASSFSRHILEVHFTNIPSNETVNTTMYVMGDDGFGLVGYAEANRLLAGVWTVDDTIDQGGVLDIFTAITNTGLASRTFDLTNIKVRKDTGETTAASPDQTGIVLAAAAQDKRTLPFTIPASLPEGTYVVEADVMEGGVKVATITSLPFVVNVAQPAGNGDVNGDNSVDNQDVVLALQIVGGLATADGGNVRRGDLVGPDGVLSVEDAAAIVRKVNSL